MGEVREMIKELESKNEEFEKSLELYTTGSRDITMKKINEDFRNLKESIKKLRNHAMR